MSLAGYRTDTESNPSFTACKYHFWKALRCDNLLLFSRAKLGRKSFPGTYLKGY
jgi:hypothetical protein